MSFMFEVYYRPPIDRQKEDALSARVSSFGGKLGFREPPTEDASGSVCLTYEFDDWNQAGLAAAALREKGEHVEGPVEYGA
ncbi:MAG: hypothetical protein L0099_03625, partial [Acidobacteria bacterium]|nr:hypothetical protein [Acidobacteriota bacterium]